MKAVIIQPPYSNDVSFSDEYFDFKLKQLDLCDKTADIIVLPEYSDVPCATSTLEQTLFYHDKYIDILLDKCVETAKRCESNVFVNALSLEPTGYRNTTYCYNKKGELVGKYFKKHLPPLELNVLKLDSDYKLRHPAEKLAEVYFGMNFKKNDFHKENEKKINAVVQQKVVSVISKVVYVLKNLYKNGTVYIDRLFDGMNGRSERVATFLAILELTKAGRIMISDDSTRVYFKKKGELNAAE